MDKEILIRNFSRFAHLYDRYAVVQKESATRLVRGLKNKQFARILEIGCGTGIYTALLRERFSSSIIYALDISPKMIAAAVRKLNGQNIQFITADAEESLPQGCFDLVTSNACFQWLNDLEKVLTAAKTRLVKKGVITFSFFGPLTFRELDLVVSAIFKKSAVQAGRFLAKEDLQNLLKRNFPVFRIKEVMWERPYGSLKNLFDTIRYTGVRGGSKGFVFTPHLLKKIEELYRAQFKTIKATYQIFFVEAQR